MMTQNLAVCSQSDNQKKLPPGNEIKRLLQLVPNRLRGDQLQACSVLPSNWGLRLSSLLRRLLSTAASTRR